MHSNITSDNHPFTGSMILNQGVVTRINKGSYEVSTGPVGADQTASRTVTCALSARLRKDLNGTAQDRQPGKSQRASRQITIIDHDPVAVGDRVRFTGEPGETCLIVEILPRSSQLSRPSAVPMPGALPFEQVIAANVSQVVPVFAAANPAPKWNMLDRYLVAAEAVGLPSLICLTKLDLLQDADDRAGKQKGGEFYEVVEDYRRSGYPVVLVSAVTGEGLDDLRRVLHGQTSILLGKSGVGKTSLLNALQPGLGLRVNEVSRATGKGRHTTTHLEMFPIDPDSAIVDTPGVREFGLWAVDGNDLAACFPEMRPFLGRCKFGLDCRHNEEPGCAVRRAVMTGEVSPRRYSSYIRLLEDFER